MGSGLEIELSINNNDTNVIVHRSLLIAATRPIAFLKRIWTGPTGYIRPGSVLANPVDQELPSKTNNQVMVGLNIVHEEAPAETNNIHTAAARVKRILTNYFQPAAMTPGSVLDNQTVVLNIVGEEVPANNETASAYRSPLIAARRAIASLKRMRIAYIQPGTVAEEREMMLGSLLPNPVNEQPNIVHEEETNNRTFSVTNVYRFVVRVVRQSIDSLSGLWTRYFPREALGEESVMKPGSAYKFVIIGLVSFAAIKSQGDTRFPFQTHPRTIMVAITSLIVLGLASKAQHTINHNSVYSFIARLLSNLSAYILVGSLASLFYH